MTPYETLRLMRDVDGVAGSFLVDRDERVLVRDLPSEVDDGLITAVGRRADAALTAVNQPLPSAAGVILHFARLSVVCSRVGKNLLVLLCAPETQTAAVKTAIRVSTSTLSKVVSPVPVPADPAESTAPRPRSQGIWG